MKSVPLEINRLTGAQFGDRLSALQRSNLKNQMAEHVPEMSAKQENFFCAYTEVTVVNWPILLVLFRPACGDRSDCSVVFSEDLFTELSTRLSARESP